MLDILKKILGLLVPPPGDDPVADHRWRWTVAVLIVVLFAGGAFHICWACGWLPEAVFGPGFAKASELAQSNAKLDAILQESANVNIINARKEQCAAIKSGNEDAKTMWATQLGNSLGNYRTQTGRNYPRVPDCSEF